MLRDFAACYFNETKRRCHDSTHVFFMFNLPMEDTSPLRFANLYDGESWSSSQGASMVVVLHGRILAICAALEARLTPLPSPAPAPLQGS